MLVHDEEKVVELWFLDPEAVVLDFDDVFFQDKACAQKSFHDFISKGNIEFIPPCIAYQNRAE